jgi:signal transduction histidine kinase
LEEAQQPIPLDQPEEEYIDQLMVLTALASQMRFAALRELTPDGKLECIGLYGFPEGTTKRALDIPSVANVPAFSRVVEGLKPFAAPTIDDPMHAPLRAMPELADVKSFVVCPVLVGGQIFGLLSFATAIEYTYTEDEVLGFQSIANGIGVSLTNHRNFHKAASRIAAYQQAGTAITAVEVAQAARHEALGIIDDIVLDAATIERELRGKPPKLLSVADAVRGIDERTQSLSLVLDKIKLASRPPAQERRDVHLRELWDQAKWQVAGRLTTAKVGRAGYVGPNLIVRVAPDWFRQVFINLIINSADAFVQNSAQRKARAVRLQVIDPGPRSATFVARFSDNAGGIRFNELRSLDGKELDESDQVIFQPSVTSKPEGSGWGLALVRRILADHNASIDLVDHRGSTVFDITLQKSQGGTR